MFNNLIEPEIENKINLLHHSFLHCIRNRIVLIFFSFLLFFSNTAKSQIQSIAANSENIITKQHFSVEDGMAAREVFCATEDKDGFMWFGTSNGLSRFDGKNFKVFNKQNFGLLKNEISFLSIDNSNHLIIQYASENDLSRSFSPLMQALDLNNYTLHPLESIFPKMPFKTKDIIWITNDANSNLIFVTAHPFQLWYYTPSKNFKLRAELKAWNKRKTPNVFDANGICNYSIVQNGSIVLKLYKYPNYLITPDTITTFSDKAEEDVFAITKNKALLDYDPTTSKLSKRNFLMFQKESKREDSFPILPSIPLDNFYWFFAQPLSDHANIMYNATKGVYLIEDNSSLLVINPEELTKSINLGVYKSFKDSRNNRWLCTTNGVIQISIKPNYFKSYLSKEQESRPTFNQVRGIYAESDLDTEGKKTTTVYANLWQYLCISKTNSNKNLVFRSAKEYAFNAILKHNHKFYIGTVNKIFEYDPLQNNTKEIGSISDNRYDKYIWSLTAISDSILLAGHFKGLSQFNIVSKKSRNLQYISPKIPKAENVYRFVKTKNKGLVAVAENGLYLIDKNNTVISYYGSLTSDKSHHLPIATIYDMQEDNDGICWIATNGEGLFRWDWRKSNTDKTIRLKQFTTKDGLPSMVLYRIEEDNSNHLWISSYNGLLRFNTRTFSSSIYTADNGLNHNEFNRTSSFKADDGRMYFGGLNGVNEFDPKQLLEFDNKNSGALRLISVFKFSGKENKLQDCNVKLRQSKEIILEAGDSFLTLDFQLLDFKKRNHLYAYKIEGIDKEWNYIDENTIRLSGLPYGKFKMHIKAQLASGKWNSNAIVFPIIVLKPFYFESWFLIVVLLILGSGIVFFFRFRTKKLKRENNKLETKISSRTTELKKALTDRERLLTEVHHRVKNNLHVINGLLQLQKDELTDSNVKTVFAEAQSRIESMALIHQNLYQNDNLGNIEFFSFANDLCANVANLYERPDYQISYKIPKKKLFIDVDTAVPLGLIVNELLTNSYKYLETVKTKKVITIDVTTLKPDEYELLYKDNGPGLPTDVDFEVATTLGLKLIKGLAKQLSGKAHYRYEKGGVFTIFFQDTAIRYNS